MIYAVEISVIRSPSQQTFLKFKSTMKFLFLLGEDGSERDVPENETKCQN